MNALQRPFKCVSLCVAIVLVFCSLPVSHAAAETIVVNFTATVTVAFGDLGSELSAGDSVTGTLELDDSVVGVFTPSVDTMFFRSEMLYMGSVTSTTLDVEGNAVSGTGGDVEIFDSGGPLAGDDSYEVTSTLDTGTIGLAVPVDFFFNPAYDDPAFVLNSGDPLFGPPPIDPLSANRIVINSLAGGSAFGDIDDFEVVSAAPPVPLSSPFMQLGMAVVLALASHSFRRASRRGRG